MTNEEWDRKVEFLLNQQARFDAGMQELKEAQAISEQKIAKVTEASSLAVEAVTLLIDVTANLANTMFEGFRAVSDRMKQTDKKIDALVDSQIRTDQRLRETFERHLRDHHGLSDA
jgi:DNA anti-recombination protein RmuC